MDQGIIECQVFEDGFLEAVAKEDIGVHGQFYAIRYNTPLITRDACQVMVFTLIVRNVVARLEDYAATIDNVCLLREHHNFDDTVVEALPTYCSSDCEEEPQPAKVLSSQPAAPGGPVADAQPVAVQVGGRVRPPPLSELPRLVQVARGNPQSPAILVSPPRSFTPVPSCIASGDVFAPSAFELLPPPARRNSRQLVASARSLSASDLSTTSTALEPRREAGTSLDAEQLEAALLGREMEQSFRASGRRIMAQGVTTIASVRGGSLVRSTFSAEVANRKLSVPDPPPSSAAAPLARPASCHQLSSVLAAGSAKKRSSVYLKNTFGLSLKEWRCRLFCVLLHYEFCSCDRDCDNHRSRIGLDGELPANAEVCFFEADELLPAPDMETMQSQQTVLSTQLYEDLRGDSASALDSASEASDLTDSSAREKARKKVTKRRRGAQLEQRWPRLLVLSVEGGSVVECQLESSKGKTVTFKFDIHDMFPRDIANNLVCT
ncbi:hypothetical protein HPB50_020003 [Hyalomma asiaticum]|uniref:Uncharacterized protein n=1 Tax=Hyalomma asiaticum TaxID=266040 RepID=A0ACB7RJS0_HYAAI|nr:hypothetical protein HPB50_020003 [Hyalomma asiaticum]